MYFVSSVKFFLLMPFAEGELLPCLQAALQCLLTSPLHLTQTHSEHFYTHTAKGGFPEAGEEFRTVMIR